MKRLTIREVARHRNGCSGEPFYAVTFKCPENGEMIATVFDEPGAVAVLSLSALPVVTFGTNSWRGDHYESRLRSACRRYEAKRFPRALAAQDGGQ